MKTAGLRTTSTGTTGTIWAKAQTIKGKSIMAIQLVVGDTVYYTDPNTITVYRALVVDVSTYGHFVTIRFEGKTIDVSTSHVELCPYWV